MSALGLALYGRRAKGTWTRVGQTHLVGRWVPASTGGFIIPAHCELVRPAGEPALPSLPTGHAYNAGRTVGYAISLFVPQRVRLGVTYGTGALLRRCREGFTESSYPIAGSTSSATSTASKT